VVALARNGHFGDAAEDVNVSQPALSQQVKKLEEELGTPLFERLSSGVQLTEAGERFLPKAMDLLDRARGAQSIVSDGEKPVGGELNIGIIPTIAPYCLPELMNHLHEDNPEIEVYIEEQQTDDLIDRLKTGSVDHLLLSTPIPRDGLTVEHVGEEPFYLAVSQNDPLSERRSVSVPEVNNEPMLLLEEGHCLRDQSLAFCRREDIDPQIVFQGSSLQSILNLVATDFGYTFVPEMVVNQQSRDNVTFVPIEDPTPKRDLILARRASTTVTPLDELFIDTTGRVLAD
jgi:LysR family hydrogen peroxide-inducible transcriptional activator